MNISSGNFHPVNSADGNSSPKASTPVGSVEANQPVEEIKSEAPVVKLETKQDEQPTQKQLVRDAAQELRQQVDELNMTTKNIQRSIRFQVDDNSGDTVVQVVDMATDELIRQIPPEEILTISRRMKNLNEQMAHSTGIFLQQEV